MDSDEGESTNEGRWRSGGCLYFLNRGAISGEAHHVSSLLPAGAYSKGRRRENKEGVSCGGRKVQGERRQFSMHCPNLTFERQHHRQKQTLFHSIIDHFFVVF